MRAADVLEQAVFASSSRGRQVLGDEDGDDEGVDGNDTGHDNGDQTLRATLDGASARAFGATRLHDEVRSERSHTSDTDT